MDNAVQPFQGLQLPDDSITELHSKADLLNYRFDKEITHCNDILKSIHATIKRSDRYMSGNMKKQK